LKTLTDPSALAITIDEDGDEEDDGDDVDDEVDGCW
jgi:hypothetical protein